MKENEEKMHFPKIDDFFTTQEERDSSKLEKIENIQVSSISNFPNHPYQVGVRIDIWTHLMRGCIINYVH